MLDGVELLLFSIRFSGYEVLRPLEWNLPVLGVQIWRQSLDS